MDADLMFSLDMLETHQACIDLEKYVLRIRGREVKFLDEHELPEPKARLSELGQDQESDSQPPGSGSSNPPTSTGQNQDSPFPGQGNTLGISEGAIQGVPTTTTSATNPPASDLKVPGIEHQVAGRPGDDQGGGGTTPRRSRPLANVAIALSLFCALLALIFSASLFDF